AARLGRWSRVRPTVLIKLALDTVFHHRDGDDVLTLVQLLEVLPVVTKQVVTNCISMGEKTRTR
ncbi:MAG: hypothetical protein ABJZ69_02030, partial [Hyphomicrobiales bacterium]